LIDIRDNGIGYQAFEKSIQWLNDKEEKTVIL
jgi:hypothetical protein